MPGALEMLILYHVKNTNTQRIMRLRRLFNIFLIIIIALTGCYSTESFARKAKNKAKSSQVAKNNKKKKKKNSSGKKKQSNRKKDSKKGKGAKNKKNKKKKGKKQSQRAKARKQYYARKKKHNYYVAGKQQAPVAEVAQNDSLTLAVNSAVLKWIPENMNPGGLRVNSVKPNDAQHSARIGLNDNFTYLPVTRNFIEDLTGVVRHSLPDSIRHYKISLQVGKHDLAYYINRIDKLPEKYRKNIPFVYPTDPYGNYSKGMAGDIVALWNSHGRYFLTKSGGWAWQRPVLFETLEDVYTMQYILPYVVPMLENAGAYVMLPRERDVNRNEVIIDFDTNPGGRIYSQDYYKEINGKQKWVTGEEEGFIYDLPDFRDTENPFEGGQYRQTKTIRSGKESLAAWYADIPEAGEYAVYVSYKTLPESTEDALYTINFSGGSRQYKVNQTMGGGTWIYLGTFPFESGYSDNIPVVTLSNISDKASDKIVTADAVKLGGGMGNIARSRNRQDIYYDPSTPSDAQQVDGDEDQDEDDSEYDADEDEQQEDEGDEGDKEDAGDEDPDAQDNQQPEKKQEVKTPDPKYAPHFSTSGLPRYLEGARYWMHWAGAPEEIYSPYHGRDDYKDDYTDRGHWVNWLAGGSRVLPDRDGLNIPVDISFALHSDAGKRADDSIIGTLGIYFTAGGASYEDGTPRINSRMLTDLLMRQITGDIRQTWEPKWTRRSMWDKSYLEARVAEVPTTLIEIMSHQNFGDMIYGLDPNFQFTVGRSIYKGMLRFMAERKGRDVVVQPLPVHNFAITRIAAGKYRLSWQPTEDKIEPTAKPRKYIIMGRSQKAMGFTKIGETTSKHFDLTVKGNDIHSFRILAVNDGGVSFPSETLALREAPSGKPTVLVINGFTRVSAPGIINDNERAGFNSREDFGVPYIRNISFSGHQYEFRRSAGSHFGDSGSDYIGKVIAGNTFDFVAVHGAAIANAGYGFVSTSAGAVENGNYDINKFKIIDLILGKQKQTVVGHGFHEVMYKAFPLKLQKKLEGYAKKGGSIYVSGQYIASDLTTDEDKKFGTDMFGIMLAEDEPLLNNRINVIGTQLQQVIKEQKYAFNNELNDKQYIVENPDPLTADFDKEAEILMQFDGTETGAAIVMKHGKRRSVAMSVPFESIKEPEGRNILMRQILNFLDK